MDNKKWPETDDTLNYEIEKVRKEIVFLSEMLKEKVDKWNGLFDKLTKKCKIEIDNISKNMEDPSSAR